MKRSLVMGAAAALAAVVIPASAAAYVLSDDLLEVLATAPASRGVAVGEGKFSKGQPADQFHVAAHGISTDARGSIRLNQEGFAEVRGQVNCIVVYGAVAGISGTLDQPVCPAGELTTSPLRPSTTASPAEQRRTWRSTRPETCRRAATAASLRFSASAHNRSARATSSSRRSSRDTIYRRTTTRTWLSASTARGSSDR